MRILVVGGTGRIGAAVVDALGPRHDVVVASRSSGIQVDISDGVSIDRMYERTGPVDAVVSVLGSTPFPPFEEMTADHVCAGIANKLVGQIDLVLRGRPHVSDGGSFTLVSGVLARDPIRSGTVASTVNGGLESFVRAAATELPRGIRINAVSPTVVTEALDVYGDYFPGFAPVPVADVARAFVKSVEGVHTGRIYELD
ncbi:MULTISPECIES: short chain dehydrogenase [unclassified Rhodococcus (in: high G+C Gram-positive bacteria)]|uniref:short chain dehydrogenase n=1 Tax=unclassified Rhodococcus (in: high G+C Gram-positive bacteria) TaxID=192944 RepID=UPI0016398F66|nr:MULTISPECIES: short chain dehydrogenase [unclassified Rhodococcus (in: high G+C Gram-positive bacteria)]MBC2640827.1 short chain dehydrogenase [Rhodococcus sp. 3A]MBC2894429.1 short chain dehydrogenase [Rhodococcus sp. 4CII]